MTPFLRERRWRTFEVAQDTLHCLKNVDRHGPDQLRMWFWRVSLHLNITPLIGSRETDFNTWCEQGGPPGLQSHQAKRETLKKGNLLKEIIHKSQYLKSQMRFLPEEEETSEEENLRSTCSRVTGGEATSHWVCWWCGSSWMISGLYRNILSAQLHPNTAELFGWCFAAQTHSDSMHKRKQPRYFWL